MVDIRVVWAFVLLFCGIGAARAQQALALPEWTPSPTLLKKLGPVSSIEGYTLHPPAGYKLLVPDSGLPEGVASYIWVGEGRKDNTHPILMLNILIPPAATPQNLTLIQIATSLLAEVKEARSDWMQTPSEAGTIQGMKFVRIGWTGIDRKEKRKMQGWILVARDGDTFLELNSQDVATEAPQALPLAEAAARTFQRLSPRILFSVQWPEHAQIFAMNPDGSNRVCLTPTSDTDYRPALSPDGTTVAFTTHRDGVRAIYLMNVDGTNPRRLTPKEDAGLCVWSPDGSQLAFSSNRDGKYCLYTMNRDGSNVKQITTGPSDDNPDWSPDGSQIVYEGVQDQKRKIFVVNAEGGPAKAVTKGAWNDRWPRWTPAGEAIVYTSYEQGKGQISLVHPDGTAKKRLIASAAEDRQPSFTADTRQILFHSDRGGKLDLYAYDLATGEVHRLTTEPKDTGEATTVGRSHFTAPATGK
jgi:Tol biopolymer transport system component